MREIGNSTNHGRTNHSPSRGRQNPNSYEKGKTPGPDNIPIEIIVAVEEWGVGNDRAT